MCVCVLFVIPSLLLNRVSYARVQFELDLVVSGDVRVTVNSGGKHSQKLFQFWFNTAMLPLGGDIKRHALRLGKPALDGPIVKDKTVSKTVDSSFRIELVCVTL